MHVLSFACVHVEVCACMTYQISYQICISTCTHTLSLSRARALSRSLSLSLSLFLSLFLSLSLSLSLTHTQGGASEAPSWHLGGPDAHRSSSTANNPRRVGGYSVTNSAEAVPHSGVLSASINRLSHHPPRGGGGLRWWGVEQ